MSFVSSVRNQEIAWPTQRKFDLKSWTQKARELCENDVDLALFQAGIWVAETLEPIRKVVETFSIWALPWELRAQYLLALCNRDYAILRDKAMSLAISLLSNKENGLHINTSLDEELFQSFEQDLFGSGKATALIEGVIDAVNLCLRYNGPRKIPSEPNDQLTDLARACNYAIAYQVAERFFYRALWLDWRVKKENDRWCIFPHNRNAEKQWEASWLRFEQLLIELSIVAAATWENDPSVRRKWLMEKQGTPTFTVQKQGNFLEIKYQGKANRPTANDFINR